MPRKPRIGITAAARQDPHDERYGGQIWLYWNYAEAISEAGGSPILITPQTDLDDLLPLLDGWMIPGGLDIDSSHYGQPNHPENELMDPQRFAMDQRMLASAPADLPILAICYGCQFLNVQRGGTLIQHIPDLPDRDEHREGPLQQYAVEPDSLLEKIVGETTISGKSYHHQGLGEIGEGLRVAARHADGTIEAIEDPSRPFLLGVQWHPERTARSPESSKIFSAFIQAAVEYSKKKS